MRLESGLLQEQMEVVTLPSGLRCCCIPKKGFQQKFGLIGTTFGGINQTYRKNNNLVTLPSGVAHFLEHKLFEDESMDLSDAFYKLGADHNAFTNHTNTAYHFNTTEHFEECFRLLLRLVSKPYFTPESVNNEKGIIEQEIRMYDDYPGWQVYLHMMENMYYNESFVQNISGTVPSIQKITDQILYDCYKDFYTPSNMVVICIGDLDITFVAEETEKVFVKRPNESVEAVFDKEPPKVKNHFITEKMAIANRIFCMGFKEKQISSKEAITSASTKILLDILFGESAPFYETMYGKGLIDQSFNSDYNHFHYFANSVLAGISKDPKELSKYILEEIDKSKSKGLDEKRFEQIKRKKIGQMIREFNDFETIATLQLDCWMKGMDFVTEAKAYHDVTLEMVTERLSEHLDPDAYVLSVVEPHVRFINF